MKRYSTDVKLAGTIYVLAENENDARDMIIDLIGTEARPEGLSLADRDIELDDEGSFLSCEATSYGIWEDDGTLMEEEVDEDS